MFLLCSAADDNDVVDTVVPGSPLIHLLLDQALRTHLFTYLLRPLYLTSRWRHRLHRQCRIIPDKQWRPLCH